MSVEQKCIVAFSGVESQSMPGKRWYMAEQPRTLQTTNVADLLERVLDKGVVIVGDIRINLVDVELLTIKIRLLIASVDKAKAIGINWWEGDAFLSSSKQSSLLETERE
jgi:Gas vesicle protein